jgi:hypothetical protein
MLDILLQLLRRLLRVKLLLDRWNTSKTKELEQTLPILQFGFHLIRRLVGFDPFLGLQLSFGFVVTVILPFVIFLNYV